MSPLPYVSVVGAGQGMLFFAAWHVLLQLVVWLSPSQTSRFKKLSGYQIVQSVHYIQKPNPGIS